MRLARKKASQWKPLKKGSSSELEDGYTLTQEKAFAVAGTGD